MARAKVSSKGWVVIPKDIRKRCGIKPGDSVTIYETEGKVTILPEGMDPISLGRGLLQGGRSMAELIEDKRRELEEEEKDLPPPRRR
jgi:AbrB family looped-hinge helix DNA binding protein